MASREETIVEDVLRDFSQGSSSRPHFENQWEEVAQLAYPPAVGTFTAHNMKMPGSKNTREQVDSTAQLAASRFMAIMDSLLTPRNSTWHNLAPSNPYLAKDRSVRLYFEEANRVLFHYRYAPYANFQGQNQQIWQSLGLFGTALNFVDQFMANTGEKGLRYRALALGECYLKENHQGSVDSVLRYFPMTLRQAHQKWGDKLPAKLVDKLKTNPEATTYIAHCIKPRDDYDPKRMDMYGKPFASYYVSAEGKALLQEGGYNTFPIAVSRYEQAPGEVYGRGPTMMMLPAIKTLNEQKKTVLMQGHRTVSPIILTADDGIKPSLRPGSVVVGGMSAEGRRLMDTLPIGRVDIGKELMDDERAVINDAHHITLFQILTETPTMTATEVMERTREKSILLAPTTGRQQSEYLGSMIERELDVLRELRLLPPMPPALVEAGGEYTVIYTSPLSRTAMSEEGAGTLRTLEVAMNYATVMQDPSAIDHFEMDEIIPFLGSINAMPTRFIRSAEQIAALRAQRAQQQQREMAATEAPGQAALISAASKAKTAGLPLRRPN